MNEFLNELSNLIIAYIDSDKYQTYKSIEDDNGIMRYIIEDEEFIIDDYIAFASFNVYVDSTIDNEDYYTPAYITDNKTISLNNIYYYYLDEDEEYKIDNNIIKNLQNKINKELKYLK